jgi:hypothetical protein
MDFFDGGTVRNKMALFQGFFWRFFEAFLDENFQGKVQKKISRKNPKEKRPFAPPRPTKKKSE